MYVYSATFIHIDERSICIFKYVYTYTWGDEQADSEADEVEMHMIGTAAMCKKEECPAMEQIDTATRMKMYMKDMVLYRGNF